MSDVRTIVDSVKIITNALHKLNNSAIECRVYLSELYGGEVPEEVLLAFEALTSSLDTWFQSQTDVEAFPMNLETLKSGMARVEMKIKIVVSNDPEAITALHKLLSSISHVSSLLSAEFIKNYTLALELFDTVLRRLGINNKSIKSSCDDILNNIKSKSKDANELLEVMTEIKSGVDETRDSFLNQMTNAADAVTAAATKHIGSTIASAYRLSAQKENVLANWFRRGSIGCFAVSAAIILYGLWDNTAPPGSFVELIYRAGPILFFTIPAFYLARESNAHRAVQRKFQHLSLNLPIGIKYIRGLDETSRHIIEAEFAKHLLMYSENSIASNNPASTPGPNDDFSLKTMISDLKSAVDKLSQP